MIVLSIDVTKVDKLRLKEFNRRDGTKGKSLELVLFESKSEYGDYMVKQQCTKEERDARKEMPILGNGKIIGQTNGGRPASTQRRSSQSAPPGNVNEHGQYDGRDEDTPF